MRNEFDYTHKKQYLKNAIIQKAKHSFGTDIQSAPCSQLYKICASVIHDMIMEQWNEQNAASDTSEKKQVYYLSIEFLTGKFLKNNLLNLGYYDIFKVVCDELGIDPASVFDAEPEPGLGSGGLGRLAACFLDSMSALNMPGCGFGIRYQYGLFKQRILDGCQVEFPDPWLQQENIWEVQKPDETMEVKFGGKVISEMNNEKLTFLHKDYFSVLAVPYDIPIVGYKNSVVNTLRLWGAQPKKQLDLQLFNQGHYLKAVEEKDLAEIISHVLYPEDSHYEGKALRLKQQYFFVSASIQSILQSYKKKSDDLMNLPNHIAIHINDTHPALAIPELMRILIDEEGLSWDDAWYITQRTITYTNHTIMEEALEKWPVSIFQQLLPRIYMIVDEINERFCQQLWNVIPGQWQRISKMSIIAYAQVRMANLAAAASHLVNGVSELHGQLLKEQVFPNFYQCFPDKFTSITNGINHRRWLLKINPGLAKLIDKRIGDSWISQPEKLHDLLPFKKDKDFIAGLQKVRHMNKKALADYIKRQNGIQVDANSIFDVHIKRLHEYKRQILNLLHIMHLYNRLKDDPKQDIFPRTFIFAAKASPGYKRAKLIIQLIHSIADRINKDRDINGRIKVLFLENYSVSLAEKIIPASDVNEQISLAGTEASGTGNMKFMLNGSLIVGTLDGANIEIYRTVGPKNMFTFGLSCDEVIRYQQQGGYDPADLYDHNPHLKRVLDQLKSGFFGDGSLQYQEIYDDFLFNTSAGPDSYFVLKDFEDFISVHEKVNAAYKNQNQWWSKAITNMANAGIFSSDRSIMEYYNRIWK